MKNNRKHAFTLVELLMVVAIIGLLASILIPTVGTVREKAAIAAGKSQLSQYLSAIQQFKGEYGYYPFSKGKKDYVIPLSDPTVSRLFIETLSGRDTETGQSKAVGGNRKRIAFHDFSEQELYIGDEDLAIFDQVADSFNNRNIIIMVDGDGDGFLSPEPASAFPTPPEQKLRESMTAWVESDDINDKPAYSLWEN
jgi:prepilin-type N-terminal cleavage/methylation domain-containing protein